MQDPEKMKEQAKAEVEQEMAAKKMKQDMDHATRSADLDIREMKFKAEQEVAKMEIDTAQKQLQNDAQAHQQQNEHSDRELQMSAKETENTAKMATERVGFENEKATFIRDSAEKAEKDTKGRDEALTQLVAAVQQNEQQTRELLAKLIEAINKPKRIIRNPQTGRVDGVEAMR